MKHTLLIILIFLFYSCSNRNENKSSINEERNDSSIDTSQIEKQLDSLFQIIKKNEHYSYIMKVYTSYSESDFIEHWLFDSTFNFIRYENEWQGEGYVGNEIQSFYEKKLRFKIDTTNDSYSEEIYFIHSDMKNIKGIKTTYTYKVEDYSIFSKGRTQLKKSNIAKVNKKFLYQEDINTIEKGSINSLNELKSTIKELKDSVIFAKGIAKINKTDSDKSINLLIDSLLFDKIINDEIK